MHRAYQTTLVCFLLAAMAAALYYPLRGHAFLNMDDPFFIEEHHVPDGLTPANLKQAFTLHYGMWMPLTWLSHMADCQLYDGRPAGHHLTSLFLHLANTLLLFLALKAMTGAFYRSGIAAGIFALHPLNVEAVAYIACRKDLLAAFFWLLTVLAYTRYGRKPSLRRYLTVCLCFCLGLMAKPVLVTLPLILLLLDYWPLGRFQREKPAALLREKLPLLAASALIGVMTLFTQQQAEALSPLSAIPISDRSANALISGAAYLGRLFWPSGLAIFYPRPQFLPWWKSAGAGLLLLAITLNMIGRRKESGYSITGWFWFVIALLPVIGLIPLGSHGMADHYAYIPGIGIFITVVWTTADAFRIWRVRKPLILFSVLATLSILGIVSRHQLGFWENSRTVFRHALDVTSGNYAAHNNLARALMEEGRLEEARDHLNQALMIHPEFPQAHNNLGVLLAAEKQPGQALAHFARAIEYRPDFAEAHYNMANVLLAQGAHTQALTHYKQALLMSPGYKHAADIHYRIGQIMDARQNTDKAAESFRQALALDPGHIEAAEKLAGIYKAGRQYDQAIDLFEHLLRKRPDCDISIAYNLACLYSLKNDPEAAMAWLKRSMAAGFSHDEWLKADQELDNIRQTPGFRELTKKIPAAGSSDCRPPD